MSRRMSTTLSLLLSLAILAATRSFSPSIPRTKNGDPFQSRQHSITFYQNGDGKSDIPIPAPNLLPLPRVNEPTEIVTPFPRALPEAEPKQVLSSQLVLIGSKDKKKTNELVLNAVGKWKVVRKWLTRPAVKFRLYLGVMATAALAVTSLWNPEASRRLWNLSQSWVSSRGFQGIANLGKSVAYVWAMVVGYPRLLDRRASERKRQSRDEALERQRAQRNGLTAEVARLRQELKTLDAEIRAFRREIISLKAYATKGDDGGQEIQEAINAEMGHLKQLRSERKAKYVAAREALADFRTQSSPEIWDDA